MNAALESMFAEAEGRYLAANEARMLTEFTSTMEQRLAAMAALERAEERIIEETLDEVWRAHPDFEKRHFKARDKAKRDVTLALRYCALAMVRQDESFLTDKLLYWMRTIIQSFHMGKVIDTTYRTLAKKVEAHLDSKHVQLLAPYLRTTHSILTQER